MNDKNIELSHQAFEFIIVKVPMDICYWNKLSNSKIKVKRYLNLAI